tara:strand:- start:149980 stop:150546 length:567 start_codon:yes stop_codon:yes gene_type:complete
MALTYTPPAENDSLLPEFSGTAVSGKTITATDFETCKGLLVMFICNHCPYVKAIENRLIDIGRVFKSSDLGVIAVCSNDAADYEEDSFANIKARWEELNYPFEYIYDETQDIARAFGAVCTPDLFLFQGKGSKKNLYYRGRLDDSWKDPNTVKTEDLKNAIESLLKDEPAPKEQISSMGCSIKWKSHE